MSCVAMVLTRKDFDEVCSNTISNYQKESYKLIKLEVSEVSIGYLAEFVMVQDDVKHIMTFVYYYDMENQFLHKSQMNISSHIKMLQNAGILIKGDYLEW